MAEAYDHFARLYDEWYQGIDYDRWTTYNLALARKAGFKAGEVLDLGCGTGSSALSWAKRGYPVTGVDRSPQMLARARQQAREAGIMATWVLGDLSRPGLLKGHQFAVVQANFDVINYLLTMREIRVAFANVHRLLRPGGVFLFDLNTAYKYRRIIRGATKFWRLSRDLAIWEERYDGVKGLWNATLTFFVKGRDNRYRMCQEKHRQRRYALPQIRALLRHARFHDIQVFTALTFNPPHPKATRLSIIARKRDV